MVARLPCFQRRWAHLSGIDDDQIQWWKPRRADQWLSAVLLSSQSSTCGMFDRALVTESSMWKERASKSTENWSTLSIPSNALVIPRFRIRRQKWLCPMRLRWSTSEREIGSLLRPQGIHPSKAVTVALHKDARLFEMKSMKSRCIYRWIQAPHLYECA